MTERMVRRRRTTVFHASSHAVARYRERFAGNVDYEKAIRQLQRIALGAKFKRCLPGNARLYGAGIVAMVVRDQLILTVYRTGTRQALNVGAGAS